jgi:4-aminobutyrate aminotransferase
MLKRQHAVPKIITKLPGPRAKALIDADEQFTSPSYTREYPLAVASGRGAVIEDVDGNQFLDFTAGIAVCATGHCHPRVVQAIRNQSERLIHMSGTDFYYAPQKDLAKRLAELAPGTSRKRVFFTNSGAESVEAALKLARYHTGRQQIIAFLGAFHGRTMGALSLTSSKVTQRRGFAPLVPGVTHVHYANCFRCPINLSPETCQIACVDQIQNIFQRTVPADEVAAIIVEPIQGEGGYVVPPDGFLPRLREIADEHRIVLIADEVQSGMGRTGKMFASEHWGVEPDIICTAKGIASGLPLGAIIARDDVMTWKRGSHASTFGGNPVSCAAALATIDLLEEELMSNADEQGQFLINRLRNMASRHACIGDVRGKGLMIGIDFVQDRQTREGNAELRDALVQQCFHKGLLLLGCGPSSIRFCPPLVITRQHCETAVAILEDALNELS